MDTHTYNDIVYDYTIPMFKQDGVFWNNLYKSVGSKLHSAHQMFARSD